MPYLIPLKNDYIQNLKLQRKKNAKYLFRVWCFLDPFLTLWYLRRVFQIGPKCLYTYPVCLWRITLYRGSCLLLGHTISSPLPLELWELPEAKLSPQTLNCEGHANTLILLAALGLGFIQRVSIAVALRRRELLRVASLDGELASRVSSAGNTTLTPSKRIPGAV